MPAWLKILIPLELGFCMSLLFGIHLGMLNTSNDTQVIRMRVPVNFQDEWRTMRREVEEIKRLLEERLRNEGIAP